MTTSNSSKQDSNKAPSLQTAMSQAVAGTLVAPLEAVVLLLRAADKISDTMYGDIKRAAMLAAQSLIPTLGVKAMVEQSLAVYEQLWLEITDPNIKRDYTNLLWIYADPKAQVTVPKVVAKGAAPQTEIVDAIKTLNMSKAVITGVSKQIRDMHDAGRAPGAGRPRKVEDRAPSTPTPPLPNTGQTPTPTPPMNTDPAAALAAGSPATPAIAPALGEHLLSMLPGGIPAAAQQPSANPAVSTGTLQQGATSPTTTPATLPAPSTPKAAQPAKVTVPSKVSVEEENAAFYGELKVRLKNPGEAAKIHSLVEAEGYTVRRKANVTPAAPAKDKTTILADQLLAATPETAIAAAAKKAAEAKVAKDAAAK